jgi:hypothetical protein
MFTFLIVTLLLGIGVPIAFAFMRIEEIKANWSKYKNDPFYVFASPLFKPSDDPRSPLKFGVDNIYNVLSEMMSKTYGVFLAPVFKVFRLLLDGADEATKSLYNLRGMLAMFWQQWLNITDVFNQRALRTMHSLRMTFVRLNSMLGRAYAAAISSVYAGISTIATILSTFDMIVKVAVIIVLILAGMMLFFFFVLWPLIPLILVAISVIAATPMGDAIGSGTVAAFCFGGETRVALADGTTVPIASLPLGAKLATGGTVTGHLSFLQASSDVYELDGVRVAGDHIVYTPPRRPCYVKAHPDARRLDSYADPIYCLMTSDRTIPIVGGSGTTWTYADWEEIEKTPAELHAWHAWVDETLNGMMRCGAVPDAVALSAPAFDGGATAGGVALSALRPGDRVPDMGGGTTQVLGVVRLTAAEVGAVTGAGASAGAWVRRMTDFGEQWVRAGAAVATTAAAPPADVVYYNLFTASGTFVLDGLGAVRDFSEVGHGRAWRFVRPRHVPPFGSGRRFRTINTFRRAVVEECPSASCLS